MVRFRHIMLMILALACCGAMSAASAGDVVGDSVVSDTTALYRDFFTDMLRYLNEPDLRKPEKKRVDVGVFGAPHYSYETKLGFGLGAAVTYSAGRPDSVTAPSAAVIYGDVSTIGFCMVGVRGRHMATQNKSRIDYKLYFSSFPTKFWGIGYDMGNDRAHRTSYKNVRFTFNAAYMIGILDALHVGPSVEFNHVKASHVGDDVLWMWNGERLAVTTFGVGVRVEWDSRDNPTTPSRGLFGRLDQRICPSWLGNYYPFGYTEAEVCVYHGLWHGAILAGRAHSRIAYGSVPWNMLSTFGSIFSMRGYYEGRYRDKGEVDLTLELRQNVWSTLGCVAWLGAANVFPSLGKMAMDHTLPNFGIGARLGVGENINVRLDYGFGKAGQSGFIFSINEAF